MNALPLPASAAGLPAALAGDAAVLPPALLTVLAAPPGAPTAAQPRFDLTLQQLLNSATAALPVAGAVTDDAVPTPEAALAVGDEVTDAQDGTGAVLPFDPALTSLQPPPAALALAQAGQAAWAAAAAAVDAPLPPTPAPGATTLSVVPAAPATVPQPIPVAVAAAASSLAADADAALTPQDAAPPTGTSAQQAAPARAAAHATSMAALPAETTAPLQDRGSGVAALPVAQPAATEDTHGSTAVRSTEAGAPARGSALLQALSERIAVQTERGAERVVIRLDPPLRGQIEIHIRQDATGATQVQLNASHADVVRQLHAIGDSLRQELAQRQGGDVNVQIAQQSREHDGRQQRQDRQGEPQQQPGRALDEQTAPADTARFALATDRP
jgi:flagellar hook-length control protein FliK